LHVLALEQCAAKDSTSGCARAGGAVQGLPDRSEAPRSRGEFRGTGTLLVVEDEAVVRSVMVRMLSSLGFEVVQAAGGKQGIDEFAAHRTSIRAVLLDLTMPEIDGEAAFQEIRRLAADVPVLFMSGYGAQDAPSPFADKGRAGFIQKPFSVDALAEALQTLLEQAETEPH
jgi:CheY-like chemotaxis protein